MIELTEFQQELSKTVESFDFISLDAWRFQATPTLRMRVRPVEPADFETISSWLDFDDRRASDGSWLTAISIETWCETPSTGLVLVSGDAAQGNRAVHAFAVVVPHIQPTIKKKSERLQAARAEIRHLVVRPDDRRRGIGTSFLHYVTCAAYAASGMELCPIVDAPVGDDRFANLIARLPFSLTSEQSDSGDVKRFEFGAFAVRSTLADELERQRIAAGLSQAALAFLAGVRRSTVAGIEAVDRLPSWQVLRQFALVLPRSLDDKRRLFLALGDDAALLSSPNVRRPSLIESVLADAWICSDSPSEWTNAERFQTAVLALRKGRQRWFFMSDSGWNRVGKHLAQRFAKELASANNLESLRFFSAPLALVQLDVEVVDPASEAKVVAAIPTVDGQLTMLPRAQTIKLVHAIRDAALVVSGGLDEANDGFSLLFPQSQSLMAGKVVG